MSLEKVTLPASEETCIVYDMSGEGRYRASWAFFYPEVDAVFFVIDSNDYDRIDLSREILSDIARHPGLKGREIPFVIISNKTDCERVIPPVKLKQALHYERL